MFSSPVESTLKLPDSLSLALRTHQQEALDFAWNKLVDNGLLSMAARSHAATLEQRAILYHEVYGCIIGHSMGLGKTLTAISFILLLQAHVFLMALKRLRLGGVPPKMAFCPNLRVLILCPRSCVSHWQTSFAEWMRPELYGRVTLPVHVPSTQRSSAVERTIMEFYAEGGIMIVGYEEYMRLVAAATQQYRTSSAYSRIWSLLDHVRQRLPLTPKVRLLDMLECADLVVLDEAHRLRRGTSKLVQAMRQHLRNTQLRLALTGTPLQNHLEEYNVMQSVVTGSSLDSHQFQKYFISPIEVGQCSDSSFQQFLEMQKCVASLRRFFSTTVHHCGPEVLEGILPERKEFVFFVSLSEQQELLYKDMVQRFSQAGAATNGGAAIVLHHQSSHICLHPCLSAVNTATGAAVVAANTRSKEEEEDDDEDEDDNTDEVSNDDVAAPFIDTRTTVDITLSPKIAFAVSLIRRIMDAKEKVVVFSHYVSHLRLMKSVIRQCFGVEANLFTGESNDVERRRYIDSLRDDPEDRVLLCSIRAGGVGINLCAANHCILLDVGWNPSDDTQATYRVYRLGQTRPVTIYRLASLGTSEQIVFFYALQKSWLHKKLLDVTDPTRQDRHRSKSYFTYPCILPLLHDGGGGLDEALNDENMSSEEAKRIRSNYVLQTCRQKCPMVARIIEEKPILGSHIESVVQHSFLLRDDAQDIISEMGKKFDALQKRKKEEQIPIPLCRREDSGASRSGKSLLTRCDDELVDTARQLGNHLVEFIMQRQEELKGTFYPPAATEESETTALVRETGSAVQTYMQKIVLHAFSASAGGNNEVAAPSTSSSLPETLLHMYLAGVRVVLSDYLNTAPFAKTRAFLVSRIPQHTRRQSNNMHSALEEALKYSPYQLLEVISDTEQTYLATELGFLRPLVHECFVLGVEHAFSRCGDGMDIDSVIGLAQLFCLLDGKGDRWDSDESDEDSRQQGGHVTGHYTHDTKLDLLDKLRSALRVCFDDLWPPGSNLALPSPAVALLEEEAMLARVYGGTDGCTTTTGLYTLPEVASHLHLQHYNGQPNLYTCPRCKGAPLRRTAPVTLECPRCHYNAEFEVKNFMRCQQHAVLYQLSIACNLLDGASTSKSFSTQFKPYAHASVWNALLRLRALHLAAASSPSPTVYHFIKHCMEYGTRVLLSEFPEKRVKLLSIQSGVGDDMQLLSQLLIANARMVWGRGLRPHLREALAQSYKDLIAPSRLASMVAMPHMCIVAALYIKARRENIVFAGDLKREAAPSGCEMLEFVCNGLVTLLYAEKLLCHTVEEPEPVSPSLSVRSMASLPSLHGSATSLTSLVRSASSSVSQPGGGAAAAAASEDLPTTTRKRERSPPLGYSPSLNSGSSATSRSSSPYSVCFSSDRESFSSNDNVAANSPLMNGGEGKEDMEPARLEDAETLQQRSGLYWMAYCEVYGTMCTEELHVFVEDDEQGMILLPPPPAHLWASHLSKASKDGMPMHEAIDMFVEKLLDLSLNARLIQ